jgi:VanZ family protein
MPSLRLTSRVGLWLPPLIYMAIIFYLSSQSAPLPAVTAVVWDKILHLFEYAGLAALFGRALVGEGLGWSASFVVAALLAAAYGATDEYHQLFVPLRSGELRDWLVDVLGASLGAALVFAFKR